MWVSGLDSVLYRGGGSDSPYTLLDGMADEAGHASMRQRRDPERQLRQAAQAGAHFGEAPGSMRKSDTRAVPGYFTAVMQPSLVRAGPPACCVAPQCACCAVRGHIQ